MKASQKANGKKQTIVLAENEKEYQDWLSAELEKKGYIILVAESGMEIPEILKNALQFSGVDLLIMSLRIEDTGVSDVLHMIQEEDIPMPPLMITGYSEITSILTLLHADIFSFQYFRKPLTPEILQAIDQFLGNFSETNQNQIKPNVIGEQTA